MNEWQLSPQEEAAWYESGLSAHGVELEEFERESVITYGRILLHFKLQENLRAEDKTLKLMQFLADIKLRYRFTAEDREKLNTLLQ
ncbi:hypothetical protein UFOVP917_27 [uncultured Caudovirales phage]|uniref:Uncharacterized protein n=1 Tax=uncultured Caudovirales phage TaxID=2100421 RepID=A0A6J5LSS6_9CAUD|nr:hypothetical protein UFOVP297_5 [uncultured Caudovirales phage]CAB4171261.1 hypothetical protein UFOVP917_27 [uncultured Caudovirales phage]CAB4182891.1 hypothetical protein UFOVP1094_29 [uncultured Caudovirales phage]CAB4200269.1 hypothetical protein UFOVP1342_29 [uncultured Caudovirales phage]CAB4213486.1 hypothetical protein UFOVP1450_29 [uncultured Caudovirales phage]